MTKVFFFSNINLKISKYDNFGSKLKDSYFILLNLHEFVSIFTKDKVVILVM